MSCLVLVRHAATEWTGVRFCGRADPALSEAGRSQLGRLVEEIRRARLSVAAVRSSPARRALETAAALAEALGVPVEADDRLREVDFGSVEGRSFDELAREHPAIAAALLAGRDAVDWPGGERACDVTARLEDVARELAAAGGDEIAVAHGGSIRALVRLIDPGRGLAAVPAAGCVYIERLPIPTRARASARRETDPTKGADVT